MKRSPRRQTRNKTVSTQSFKPWRTGIGNV